MTDPIFKVKTNKTDDNFAEFVIEPLEPGFGYTLGHAMRRVLLSSIPGAAVVAVRIAGVKHKFSEVPGLKENVVDLLLNIKGLNIKLSDTKDSATLKISVKGAKTITGKDVEVTDGVEIANPDHYIGALSGDKSKLEMELVVENGYGYSLAEERQDNALGMIVTDAVYSPIKRVNYTVEATRVGRRTNMDKLVLQVWTNGSVSPKEALDETSKVLAKYFTQIFDEEAVASVSEAPVSTSGISEDVLKMTVDELDLPTRIYNSLRNGGIETLGQLLSTPRKELISMRNMGAKSIAIIDDKLKEKGISITL
ncbi:MAG TPA: DNA-directed RNA polymerase subunit alpha [Patescibacteria group bacterium]|nr:DNA-directed RNA polymerase subunit alpha [Patescibacteria group bacterium]